MRELFRKFICVMREPLRLLSWFCLFFPGQIGQLFRILWASIALRSFGRGARLGRGCSLRGTQNILIGDNVTFDEICFIDAIGGNVEIGTNTKFNRNVNLNASVAGSIIIGNDCLIGPNVVMRTAGHVFSDTNTPIQLQGHEAADIKIGNDVWLGANAVILPGVVIGDQCVVGAGSVVTKSFENCQIIAGVPAKAIGNRV